MCAPSVLKSLINLTFFPQCLKWVLDIFLWKYLSISDIFSTLPCRWTPTLIFSEMGHRKIKPNGWVESSLKMKNLHRCHCLQIWKNSKNIPTGVQRNQFQKVIIHHIIVCHETRQERFSSDFPHLQLNVTFSFSNFREI